MARAKKIKKTINYCFKGESELCLYQLTPVRAQETPQGRRQKKMQKVEGMRN